MFAAAVLALALSPTAIADGLFADGFELDTSCEAAIDTPVGPRERVNVAAVSYGVYPAQRLAVDMTEWDQVWGYNNATAPAPVAWPGVGGAAPVLRLFPRFGYTASHFRTPEAPAGMSGWFSIPSYVAGPNVIVAISAKCGDFTEHLPTPGCLVDHQLHDEPWTGTATSDAITVRWKFSPNAPTSQCNLEPASDYYVNVMFADPLDSINCPASHPLCVLGTVSYHN